MANETTNTAPVQEAPRPDAALKQLDRLVGSWKLSGGVQGQVTYEWMGGAFFLLQHVEIERDGHLNKGLEIIGRECCYGATEPSEDIKSRYYDNLGNTFDYVYEMEGDTLTIWGGEKGSPAYFKGTFSKDGNTITGGWVYPGGGYESISTRVK
jgi:hypothetical protein